MKILIVATECGSGMLPFVGSIVNTLSKCPDLELYGVFVSKDKSSYKKLINPNVACRSIFIEHPPKGIRSICFKFFPYSVIKAINQQICNNRITHIHYMSVEYTLALYDKIFSKNKYERFFTVHDLIPHEQEYVSFMANKIQKYIDWGAMCHVYQKKFLTTSSIKQYNQLKEMFPEKGIAFTPFPTLVTPSIQDGDSVAKEIAHLNDYILFLGNVDAYKGVDLLFQAWKMLENPPALIIAGRGIPVFETQPEKGLYRLNRFILDEEIKMLFSRAKVVVYPYRSATMSGVLSLSYFFRKNLLVSDVSFFMDNIDGNALVFKKNDLNDLFEKLKIAINRKSQIESDFYDSHYNENLLIKKFCDFYLMKK